MNKFILAAALCASLAACKKDDAAPVDAAAPADTRAAPSVETAPTPAATNVQAGLPKECQDYIERVKTCVAKSSGAAAGAQFQAALDQTKAQWEAAADKSALAPACVQANQMFAQQAAAMKCE